ncbi:hypothetical protein RN001_007788 [Aquatica leii]|uniref:Uncharacterized protein n=1 Tax=Aquatica leii TaxID=1421715 RepID=A0AAN7P8T6_9COLE|nr:hypothetical protein RN001_007788 [Aquatica leii]
MPKVKKSVSAQKKSRRMMLRKARKTKLISNVKNLSIPSYLEGERSFSTDFDNILETLNSESEEKIVSDRDTDPKDVTDVSSVDEDQYSDASLLIESDTETDHIQKEKVLTGRRVVDIQYFLSALK